MPNQYENQDKTPPDAARVDLPNREEKVRLLTLADLDGRTKSAKLTRDLIEAVQDDLGGADRLTVAQRQLVQRVAILGALAEDAEAKWLQTGEIDLAAYNATANTQRRLLATLGIQRTVRDVPSLRDYLEAKQ